MGIRKISCFVVLLLCFSCQQDYKVQNKMNNNETELVIDSLEEVIDSLQFQLQLYQDTILEQNIRLEKIRTILEPLIQQEVYE